MLLNRCVYDEYRIQNDVNNRNGHTLYISKLRAYCFTCIVIIKSNVREIRVIFSNIISHWYVQIVYSTLLDI